MIIHYDRGEHWINRSLVLPGFYQANEGKAIGLFEVLSWFEHSRLERVIVEMD